MHPEIPAVAPLLAELDHARALVEHHHLGTAPQQLLGVQAGPAGGVEDPLARDVTEEAKAYGPVTRRPVGNR